MTHELARSADMDDYFSKKFHPMEVLYVVGRSYASSPTCTPQLSLYYNWKEHFCMRLVSVSS